MSKNRLDERGHEKLDPRPMSLPVGFKRPESLQEQIQRLVRTAVSQEASASGFDTFDEDQDFDVDDEIDISTPYEMEFDPVLGREVSPDMLRRDADEWQRRYVAEAVDHPETDARIARERRRRGLWPFRRSQSDVEEAISERGGGSHQKREPSRGRSAPEDDDSSTPT